jgi:hypothetical protein
VLVLFGRAVNIFPLSYLLNFFRDHKITPKMMFIMWFSGEWQPGWVGLSLGLEGRGPWKPGSFFFFFGFSRQGFSV